MPNNPDRAICIHCQSIVPLSACVPCRGLYYCLSCANTLLQPCPRCSETVDRTLMQSGLCSRCRPSEVATWHPTPVASDTGRCFGVEFETSHCDGYRSLRGHTCFGAKYDGSISGMEFDSPILQGDRGLNEIRAFCKCAKELGFTVNGDCGLHIHIDMRDTMISQRKSIAYAYRLTYPIWASLVNQYRAHDCRYCCAPNYSAADIVGANSFTSWCEYRNRYEFINLTAYSKHKTFEIRGHQGTLNPVEVINWIEAHLRFVEFVKGRPLTELLTLLTSWKDLKKILGPDLARYYGRKRIERLEPTYQTDNNLEESYPENEVLGGRPSPFSWVHVEPRDRDLWRNNLYQSTPTNSFNEFVHRNAINLTRRER